MKWNAFLFLIVLTLLASEGMSQNPECVLMYSGKVYDHHDDQVLVGAVIRLDSLTTISDAEGWFAFNDLCSGNYVITISHIDCDDFQKEIKIESNIHDQQFYLEHHSELLEEITVSETAHRGQDSQMSQTRTSKELFSKKGNQVSKLLEGMNGVSFLETGATIAKPVINGLHSQRLQIINNDLRLQNQEWGAEHAPEIDNYSVEAVSVIQGAGSVAYGSDALGGVILIEPKALPDRYGISFTPQLAFDTNGRGGSLAFDLDGKKRIAKLPVSFQLQGSGKKAGNLKAPKYYLDNTGQDVANFQARVGYVGDQLGIEAKLSQYHQNIGILTDSHIGNEYDLLAIIENGQPFVDRGFSYDIKRPRQNILHEVDQIKGYANSKWGKWEAQFSRQYNRRSEYDRKDEEPGLRLKTETYSGKVELKQKWREKTTTSYGVSGNKQRYRSNGFYLIPEYDQISWGSFAYGNHSFSDSFSAELGLRYDWMDYTYYIPFEEFRRIDADDIRYKEIIGDVGIKTTEFSNLWGASTGFRYDLNEDLQIALFAGLGSRAPLPNELYSDGVHHGTAVWDVGDPDLQVERAKNVQINGTYSKEPWKLESNVFFNRIDNYTYNIPDQNLDPIFTIRGSYPIFRFIQNDAMMQGANYTFSYTGNQFSISTAGNFLWADDVEANQPLYLMPSNQLHHKLSMNNKKENVKLSVGLQNVFEQKRVPNPAFIPDYAPPPPGYSLVNMEVDFSSKIHENPFQMGLLVDNLFNVEYKNYLDRFRYFAHAPGINFGLRIRYEIS